jgi:hypothetical protein
MTKADMVAMIGNIPAKDLRELEQAIKARKKASSKTPSQAALALLKGGVQDYGWKDIKLAFTAVRREQIEAAKAAKAAKAPKAKPAKKTKG